MNSRQLQYVVTLSEILNISQAAEKLNISQPALSKQILALEKEIGVTLFDRSTFPIKLTAAGESFVLDAREILFKEQKLKSSMNGFKTGKKGRLVIGISPFRAFYFLSDIIKKLQTEFEGLQIVLNETNSIQLHQDAADGKVDFAIINLPVDEALLKIIPLEHEPVLLAIPREFAVKFSNRLPNKNEKYPVIDISECKDIPFITLSKNQELKQLFDKLCMVAQVSPVITTEVVSVTTAWSLAKAGVGATLLPIKFAENDYDKEKMILFQFKNSVSIRQPVIVYRKGLYLSDYAKRAIELISCQD